MKKNLSLILALVMFSALPAVLAVHVGTGITPEIITEEFEPRVWMCGDRVVYDDNVQPWRTSEGGQELVERFNNYAFEGEQIQWLVLVMDKNKIDQNIDVYGTVGSSQGAGNQIEVNCLRVGEQTEYFDSCNARIEQEYVDWNPEVMDFFQCTFTVETPQSMYGEHWITVEAMDGTGLMGTMAENEYWFLNPVIALSVDGFLSFQDVRPGTDAYSSTLLLGNDADHGSGVLLDMFISGTDFYDSSSSGARCPTTNQLSLTNFGYFATSGAYSTLDDPRRDNEGYVGINYGNSFSALFFDSHEIIQAVPVPLGNVNAYGANVLAPGAEMALTFKLSLPEPCQGNFDTGSIFFWGEAI
jgi:hypothetical protein